MTESAGIAVAFSTPSSLPCFELELVDVTMPERFPNRRALSATMLILSGFLSFIADLRGEGLACGCRVGACGCIRRTELEGWQIVESQSFRIHHVGPSSVAKRLAPLCEQTRLSLQKRWLADTTKTDWTPKCDLFLYPSGAEFQRLTRLPMETWGFADLEIGDGKVWLRRLHVRADDSQRLDKLLVHELTHVVLADHFTKHQIPRWADEGIAVLSEPVARRNEMRRWLNQEAAQGRVFSLKDLSSQRQVPRDKQLGDLFYAQSSALVDFLLTKRKLTESELLRFVSESESRGLHAAMSRWFPDVSVSALESEWRQWMTTSRADFQLADEEPRSISGVAHPVVSVD